MNIETIQQVFDKHKTDKGFYHEYYQMYYDVFTVVPNPTKILEIGVKNGRSVASWCELFPKADVVGLDYLAQKLIPAASFANIIIGDSKSADISKQIGSGFDVIIEDGDHHVDHQWDTFQNFKRNFTKAYVIEDVYGVENVAILQKRLISRGFTNLKLYQSKKTDAAMVKGYGTVPIFAFYAIVVYKD
jgi:hypothetical protein